MHCLLVREACSIELEDQVIVTGGEFTRTRVDVYNMEGWVMELPELNPGRRNHGFGHYINSNNKMVNCIFQRYC